MKKLFGIVLAVCVCLLSFACGEGARTICEHCNQQKNTTKLYQLISATGEIKYMSFCDDCKGDIELSVFLMGGKMELSGTTSNEGISGQMQPESIGKSEYMYSDKTHNPNFSSLWCYAVDDEEYTYFIHHDPGKYLIARIGFDPFAQPEPLFSVSEQEIYSITHLMLSKDSIYFIQWNNGETYKLWRIDKSGNNATKVNCALNTIDVRGNDDSFFLEKEYLYYQLSEWDDEGKKLYRFDLETATETIVDLSPLTNNSYYFIHVLGVYNDMIYYIRGLRDEWDNYANGIYYSPVDSLTENRLCFFEWVENYYDLYYTTRAVKLSGHYLFLPKYVDSDYNLKTLLSVDLRTGEVTVIGDIDSYWGPDYVVQNGEVYYSYSAHLWKTDPKGTGKMRIITDSDPEMHKCFLSLGGGWMYYNKRGYERPSFFRASLEDLVFPSEPFSERLNEE